MSHKEEPELKASPAADDAMPKLVELFSEPDLPLKARFRCGVEGTLSTPRRNGLLINDAIAVKS
jgi:hypothetical protein